MGKALKKREMRFSFAGSGGPCPLVLDVRTAEEWSEGHVACAHRIPVQDNQTLVEQVPTNPASTVSYITYSFVARIPMRHPQLPADAVCCVLLSNR
jgi:rhodanese-related sulfurtransferase